MLILTQNKKKIVNVDKCVSVGCTKGSDAKIQVFVKYSNTSSTLGVYDSIARVRDIFRGIVRSTTFYEMPEE